MKICAVIPTLNEAQQIGNAVRALQADPDVANVVVADGNSSDDTHRIAEAAGAQVVVSAPGRGTQLNRGADRAGGDVVWFVHADCRPPVGAGALIKRCLRRHDVIGGAFRTWTVRDDRRPAWWLHLADVRSRYTGLPYGDQALFLRRRSFERVNGFRTISLMEDLDLVQRVRTIGRLVTLPACVRVSGRRFIAHPVRDTLLVNTFPALFRLGVSPEQLARWYAHVR